MNLLAQPSFEDVAPWTLGDTAVRWAGSARTGAFGVLLSASSGFPATHSPFVLQLVNADVGRVYELSVYARHSAGAVQLELGVYEGGVFTSLATLAADDPDGSWERITAFHTPTQSESTFSVQATGAGSWDIDDAAYEPVLGEVSVMQRGLQLAWSALANRLLTIRRENGYHHDLTRVLSTKISPAHMPCDLPFACLPAFGSVAHEVDEDTVTIVASQPVFIFSLKGSATDFENSIGADLRKWHDDLVRAVMEDDPTDQWALGDEGHIDQAYPSGGAFSESSDEGLPPCFRFDLTMRIGVRRANLGPQGA